ncbi:hypothetical protein HHI36_011918 [Cryptolaemus montrouzieri]|uniref:Uncharacterized protein n=1 Tax=Cryptolaemus montrouzieri TaxID=559131 RepID=A0ABD2NCR0_9CUCU
MDSKAIYYMIYSDFSVFKLVIDQIRSSVDIENPPKNKFHVVVIPRVTYLFEKELEEYGLFHTCVKLHSYQWLPIHIDTGILSLEIPFCFRSLFINQDLNYLPMFSKCLWQLLLVVGKVDFILALGQYSNGILSQLDTLWEESGYSDKLDSDIGGLILMDRSLDYTSTLLTPGIYSALLKEVYKVNAGYCESKHEDCPPVDSKFNPNIKINPVVINLNSEQDQIYASIKNKYFTEVTSVLSSLTKELKKEKLNSKEMSVDEIKKYVQTQLGATNSRKKNIANHLIAAETIVNVLGWRFENLSEIELNIINNASKSSNLEFLMELMCIENNELVSLRLFCLLLVTQELSENEINQFWGKFLHHFGYKYGYVLQNLTNAGMISDSRTTINKFGNIKIPKFSSKQFYSVANRLKQIPSHKIDYQHPTCPSYVFRGAYIPLITQISSMVLNSMPLEEIKSKLEDIGSLIIRNERGYPLQKRTLLVFVIGGVTYAEIGALNFIEDLTGVKVIVLSDQIISGNDLMENFLELAK